MPADAPGRRGGQGLPLHPRRHERRADPDRRRVRSATGAGSSDKASTYATERVVFGRPIGANQGVQFPIAQAYAPIEAADLMRYKAAVALRAGPALRRRGEHGQAARPPRPRGRRRTPASTPTAASASREEYDVERKFRETRLYIGRPGHEQPRARLRRPARARHAALVLMADFDRVLEEIRGRGYELPGFADITTATARGHRWCCSRCFRRRRTGGRTRRRPRGGIGCRRVLRAEHADAVVGVEPHPEMREVAVAATEALQVRTWRRLPYATGLPDARADIVSCSQSLQWMEPRADLRRGRAHPRPGAVFAAYEYRWSRDD